MDLIVVKQDGQLGKHDGTPAAPDTLAFPSPEDGDVVLAAVYVPPGASKITAALIVPCVTLESEATGHLIWRNLEQFNTAGQAHRTIEPGTAVGRIDERGNLWLGTNEFVSNPDDTSKGQMADFLYSTAAERFFTHSIKLTDLGDPADLNNVRFGPEGLGNWDDEGLDDAYFVGNGAGGLGIGQIRMTPVRHPYKGYVAFTVGANNLCTSPALGRANHDKLWVNSLSVPGTPNPPDAKTWVYLRDVNLNQGTFKLASAPNGTPITLASGSAGVLLWPGLRGLKFTTDSDTDTLTADGTPPPTQATRTLVCRSGPAPLVFGRRYYAKGFSGNSFKVAETDGGPPLAFETDDPGLFDVVGPGARDEDSGVIIVMETAGDDLPRALTDAPDRADRTAASQIRVRLARVGYDEAEDVMRFNQRGEVELGLGGVGTEGNVVTIGGYAGRNAVQRIVKTGEEDIEGGTFTLYYYGPPPQSPGFHEQINSIAERETGPLSFDATAQQIEDALELIPEIGPNNVEVTGTQLPTGPITIEFRNDLGNTNLTRLGITTNFTPSVGAGLRVVSAQRGYPPDSAKPLLHVRDEGTVQTAPRTAPFVEVRDRDNDAVMEVSHTGGLDVLADSTRHVGAGLGFSDILRLQAPRLWWRLGEAFGTTAEDSSGNEDAGTYAGAITLGSEPGAISGDPNTAVELDGANGRIHTSEYVPWANAVRTFAGWAWRNTDTSIDTLIGGSIQASPRLRLEANSGTVTFRPEGGFGGAGGQASWTGAWPGTGVWVHYVLIFNPGSSGTAELFINGLSKGAVSVSHPYSATPGDLRIGATEGTAGPFHGKMDEFAIWERALTPAEIGLQYTAGVTPRGEIVLGQGADTSLSRTGAGIVKLTDVLHLSERAADPPTPAANDVHVYARDNGSGKTGLYAKFSSGAVQEITADP